MFLCAPNQVECHCHFKQWVVDYNCDSVHPYGGHIKEWSNTNGDGFIGGGALKDRWCTVKDYRMTCKKPEFFMCENAL